MEFDVLIEIPQGQPQQVRGRPRDRPDAAGPHAVHLDAVPGRLRLHRGHPRRRRRSARRAGAPARRPAVPGRAGALPRDRHVPDDRREGRRRQGALRARQRPAAGAPARHPPRAASSTGSRSSTSSRSTRSSSPASPSRAPSWVGRAEAEQEIARSRQRLKDDAGGDRLTRRAVPLSALSLDGVDHAHRAVTRGRRSAAGSRRSGRRPPPSRPGR